MRFGFRTNESTNCALVFTEAGTVGLDPITSARAPAFAMTLLLPFVWALGVADIPDLYQEHILPARRWRRGACPACGCDMRGHETENPAPIRGADGAASAQGAAGAMCPECGSPVVAPLPYRYSWATVLRFVMLVFFALVIGSTVAEASMLTDERRLERSTSVGEVGRGADGVPQAAPLAERVGDTQRRQGSYRPHPPVTPQLALFLANEPLPMR